jgi:hypothetical protein
MWGDFDVLKEHGKVCFEQLEINFRSSKHLAPQRGRIIPKS